MIDQNTTQVIQINNTPYSTTTFYSGTVVLGEKEYEFTVTRVQDNSGYPNIFIDWIEDKPENLLEIEKEIEDTFEEMISENE